MEEMENITWEWGELPQVPSKQEVANKEDTSDKREEDKRSGGLFQFMRKTKKIRHQPEQEGIYLDDLNLDDMDPEVAALYLYPRGPSHLRTIKDDDNESGRGASLPQSPITVEKDMQHHSYRPGVPDVAMSLCGGLKESEGEISTEKFMQFLVTYDNFCENPNLMADANLVIRIGDKYYNWQTAGAIIMSVLCFQRPLVDSATEQLIKQHMPKKESRRRGWFSWGRGAGTPDEGPKPLTNKEDGASPPSSEPPSAPGSPQKPKEKREKRKTKRVSDGHDDGFDSDDESDTEDLEQKDTPPITPPNPMRRDDRFKKSLKLTNEQIVSLNLKEGPNEITYSITTQFQGTTSCTSHIYLWKYDDRIIVSDIDGTITRSDVLGQVLPMIGKDWSQAGITSLYNMISRNGYRFIYLSARAIGQSKLTRDYLQSVKQCDLSLPAGPMLLSPSSLISAFHKEVIERKPEEFKINCLRDIGALFPNTRNPFYSGFGNKINDVWAYRAVGIPISRIFTVNPKGELKLDSTHMFQSSYSKLGDIVDHLFPPLLDKPSVSGKVPYGNFPAPYEFSTFTYWRAPLLEIDIEVDEFLKKDEKVEKTKK